MTDSIAIPFEPLYYKNNVQQPSSTLKSIAISHTANPYALCAVLNSSLFWYFYTVYSDCYHLNEQEFERFHIGFDLDNPSLISLGQRLIDDFKANSRIVVRDYKGHGKAELQQFYAFKSKPILDEIDTVLAKYYGFTAEELDFIINYDIKYRMGRGSGEEDE